MGKPSHSRRDAVPYGGKKGIVRDPPEVQKRLHTHELKRKDCSKEPTILRWRREVEKKKITAWAGTKKTKVWLRG